MLARLSELRVTWVAVALAVTVPQVLVLAWRWRFTAARLGIELPLRVALAEYYLGILLNQLLPGGVLGDVSRAWRHARASTTAGPAVRSVILERVSAQVVMTLVAIASVLALPWGNLAVRVSIAAGSAGVLALALLALARRRDADSVPGRFVADARRAILSAEAFVPQLVSALFVVASYIAVFLLAARAVGASAALATTLPLVAPVLMTMLVPLTVAGWGIREAAAVWLWGLAGLTPEDGAAISVAYGLLVLVSSGPGVVPLIGVLLAGRGRRARPRPG